MSRVKQSLFNILIHKYSNILRGAYVLDLFCGSGSLGLEALSLGAKYVFMVDKDVNDVTYNCRQFQDQVTVMRTDIIDLPKSDKACGIVFIDPPYKLNCYEKILHDLIRKQWVRLNSIVIVEMDAQKEYDHVLHYELISERKYGKARILILRFFMPFDIDTLRALVIKEFPDAKVSLEDTVGDSNHFALTVSSGQFNGKTIVEQHKMVYNSLKGKVGSEIHALQLTTIAKGSI